MSTKQKLEIVKNALLKIYAKEENPETPFHQRMLELSTKIAIKKFSSQYKGINFFTGREIEEDKTIERD